MNEKEQVAKEAINYIKDGMIIGLGTGSQAIAWSSGSRAACTS